MELHQEGVPFLDARTKAEYEEGHIAGAGFLSGEDSPQGDDGPVVVYGQGPDLEEVLAAAEILADGRRGPVYVLLEGLEGWLAAGNDYTGGS